MAVHAIGQYLNVYAESEAHLLHGFPQHRFEHCIVIPCFAETTDFIERLRQGPLGCLNALVIIVVNQPAVEPVPLNLALLDYMADLPKVWQYQHLRLHRSQNLGLQWLIVDRTKAPLPAKQGVGLARKIGCDIAVALHHEGKLASNWLHSTDADAHLPRDYLPLPETGYAAAVYQFQHVPAEANAKVWLATQVYEQALRYYIAGLRWAGSPYAHQPIGSTLAFTATAYCQARGFPKRSAGEDFYLLNKLSKLGAIYTAPAVVAIEARTSDRVPFGTGPEVLTISQLKNPWAEFCYYHPHIFVQLKHWHAAMPQVWQNRQQQLPPLTGLEPEVQQVLADAGIDRLWAHIERQAHSADACLQALNVWFDAFQTLKFVRRLQAMRYRPLPLQQCLQEAPFSC